MPKNMPNPHPEAQSKKLVCGSCKWFSAGYKGITCQKTREVVLDTVACEEYIAQSADPYIVLVRDKYVLAVRQEIRESARLNLFDQWRKEVSGYVTDIDDIKWEIGSHQTALLLNQALQKIIGFRFRVSEIYTGLIEQLRTLEEVEEKVYVWLSANYEQMRDLKTEKAKQVAMQRCVPELYEAINCLKKTHEVAKYVDGKLDANDYTLRDMLKSVNATSFMPTRNAGGF